MLLRETSEEFTIARVGRNILDLPRRITEPSKAIIDEGTRRKARFLSVTLFLAVFVFPILQITTVVTKGIPFYSGSTVLLAGFYLLSRTEHVKLTSALLITFSAISPFLILLMNPIWESFNLSFQILSWPILAALLGSQLLSKLKEALLIMGMNIGLVLVCIFHPGIAFLDAIELLSISFGIQALLWFTSWTNEYYTTKIEQSKRILETRRRELEIYTNVLRHDLSNDIQLILAGLELIQMTPDDPKRHASYLESTLAASERMKSLIHIFSITEDELDNDIVTVLELICKRAQIGFKNMIVTLEIDDDVRNHPVSYGNLTTIAFENLLRNTEQHAGNAPKVRILISLLQDHLEIIFEDDGPGIPEEVRDKLFERGVTTGDKGKGLGLYLTKIIIESEGGSITLIEKQKPGCCFQIRLPLH